MKSKKLQFIYLLGFCTLTYFIFSSSSGGVTGKATSGCGGNGCHTAGNTTINLSGIPATYVYGTTYTCTLAVTNIAKVAAGFDLTVNLGTIQTITGQGTTLFGTTELHHSAPKLDSIPGTAFWLFKWTAPASGGQLIVNVAGNAVDNTGTSSNDFFGTNQFTFAAPAVATSPTVTNVSINGITSTGATVNASVNANGSNTTAVIEYGLTAAYGSSTAMTPSPITGITPTAATGNITGLTPNTLYHYRVKATNAGGITSSTDATFTTLNAASVNSIEQSNIEIYPNPVIDYLMYNNKANPNNVQFTIIAVNGTSQLVQIEKISNGNYKIQTNTLATGNYVLLMELDGKKYYHHFSK